MCKLVIITGVSGTGKTTLAQLLYEKIENSSLLSYDKFVENMYDIVGFKNRAQKNSLKSLNEKIYSKLLEECLKRKDEVVILEKPFKIKWKNYLDNLSKKYNYEVFTINLFAKDFDTIWNRLLKREMSKKERHPSHYLDSYYLKYKSKYKPFFEFDYASLKAEYDDLLSNSINLGTVISIQDIEDVSVDALIKTILN